MSWIFFRCLIEVDCGDSVALEREQPLQSMLVPKRTPFRAVAECARNRAPFASEGTPPQDRQMWLGPPSAPPLEMESEGARNRQSGGGILSGG